MTNEDQEKQIDIRLGKLPEPKGELEFGLSVGGSGVYLTRAELLAFAEQAAELANG